MIEAYPLTWPIGRPRTRSRQVAPFSHKGRPLDIGTALGRLRPELTRLGARNLVISSNLKPRADGAYPLARQANPADPGVAVYFSLQDRPHCMSCDKWTHVADNLDAIAKHVQAIRGQLRWGAADVGQVFAGFLALPALGAPKPWWEVLGVRPNITPAELEARRLELAQQHHPDRGGNPDQMAEINSAYDQARKEIRA